MFKDFVNFLETPYDDNGHGSQIATIIGGTDDTKGIAENCQFIVLKAFDSEGNSNIETLNTSLEWILQNYQKYKIDIINMSLGIEELNSVKHTKLKELITKINNKGIIIVSAAGNGSQTDRVMAPSSYEEVICVGSITETQDGELKKSSYSRSVLDLSRKNKEIIYTYGSNIAIFKNGTRIDDIVSGTSYSTAIVSGLLCLIKERYKFFTNDEIRELLMNYYSNNINGMKVISVKN